jgi:hypothetical protein
MTALALCVLCDALVSDDVWEHYERCHPERHRGDWDLATWPDGEQVLVVSYLNPGDWGYQP